MSGLWLDLLAEAWKTVTAGVLAGVLVAIIGQPRDGNYSCAPADSDEDDAGEIEDDTAAWDRGHDEWMDRQVGL